MTRIIIVEDDRWMRDELTDLLQKSKYEVTAITSFQNIATQIVNLAPDLVLLDINLPNESGFDICKSLQSKGIGPILMLTSRDQLKDELHGLQLGADDYLTKPCNGDRLLARIRNLLRRLNKQPRVVNGGSFSIDSNTFTLYKDHQSIVLPTNEGKLLTTLIEYKPRVVSKSTLNKRLWGTDEYIDDNALQVNITRLRKTLRKIDLDHQIETIRGHGYRFKG